MPVFLTQRTGEERRKDLLHLPMHHWGLGELFAGLELVFLRHKANICKNLDRCFTSSSPSTHSSHVNTAFFRCPWSLVDITAHVILIEKNISQIGSGLTEQFVLGLLQFGLNIWVSTVEHYTPKNSSIVFNRLRHWILYLLKQEWDHQT